MEKIDRREGATFGCLTKGLGYAFQRICAMFEEIQFITVLIITMKNLSNRIGYQLS